MESSFARNDWLQSYLEYERHNFSLNGQPDTMTLVLPERPLVEKRDKQIFLPRPNNLMNTLARGKKSTVYCIHP